MTCGDDPRTGIPVPPVVLAPTGGALEIGATRPFVGSGGVPPYSYSATRGTFVDALYAAPGTAGSDTIRVTDTRGAYAETVVTIYDPVVAISPTSLPIGINASFVFSASGGFGEYTSGALRGTMSNLTTYTAPSSVGADTVRVANALGRSAEAIVAVYDPRMDINPINVAVPVNGTRLFSVTGGYGTYTYEATAGTLVEGLFTAPASPTTVTLHVADTLGHFVETTVTVFDPAPTVTSIQPTGGVTTGGTNVVISGSNFAFGDGATVTIGGVACGNATWNTTSISCTTGPGTLGPKDVVVRNASGITGTLESGYTYLAPEAWTTYGATGTPPSSRTRFAHAWSGSALYVWGGLSSGGGAIGNGAVLGANDAWTSLGNAPYSAWDPSGVWTGSKFIVWGGNPGSAPYGTQSGAAYTPGSGWFRISTSGACPSGRTQHSVVWGADRMIIWGGQRLGPGFSDGGRYDPAGDQSSAMAHGADRGACAAQRGVDRDAHDRVPRG